MIDRKILRDARSASGVEYFIASSKAANRRPAILFVHGHQAAPRPGALLMAQNGALEFYAKRYSVVAAAISQPGYGGSSGPTDYSGPVTQRAIRAVLDDLRHRPDVDPKRLVLYGVSRGAIASAMVATQEPDLLAAILIAGVYDLASFYPSARLEIQGNIDAEAGASGEAMANRSAVQHVKSIGCEVILLQGRDDNPEQAEAFADAVRPHDKRVSLFIVEGGHVVPLKVRRTILEPFFDRFFDD